MAGSGPPWMTFNQESIACNGRSSPLKTDHVRTGRLCVHSGRCSGSRVWSGCLPDGNGLGALVPP